jgi:hypothetical protein
METMGTLITVYRGHDIREQAKVDGISMGVAIWKNGAHIGDAKNTAAARNQIDIALQKTAQPARVSNDTRPAAKFPKRFENNPNDLI